MKLVIVESPNKTKTIGSFLGPDYLVLASKGHIRDLATTGKGGLGVDIEHGFKPTYVVMKDKIDVVNTLKRAVKKADDVYLATDPDREGEAIAWHLAEVLGLDVKTVKRLSFNAITKKQVLDAMEHPSHIDMDLVASQETRRILDRIIGFDLSKLMKVKLKAESAGRVQSVTLRMIVEHQKEIDSFVPKKYWTISGEFGKEKISADLYSKDDVVYKPYSIDSEEKYKKIMDELPKEYDVLPLSFSKRVTMPKPPFTTSTMEQEAYNQFKYSAKRTSQIAQSLFEGVEINGTFRALITYIRTDSTRLAPEFVETAGPFIAAKFGPGAFKGNSAKKGKSSNLIQDAHEAIRPIDLSFTPAMAKDLLKPQMYNLYRLIYARALASLMGPKIDQVTTLKFAGNGYVFKTDAVKNESKGYQLAYEFCGLAPSAVKTAELPSSIAESAEKHEKVEAAAIHSEEKETKPPFKYNDGTVIRLMEEKGIGRPSTYSTTLDTLQKRQYLIEDKHALTPTETGKLVVDRLEKFFPTLMDYNYTRDMESDLEKIKSGDSSKNELLSNFYTKFVPAYDYALEHMEKVKDRPTGELCPVCGSPLVVKKSRYGTEFVACSNYPTCHYVKKEVDYVEGRTCPKCGGKLVYRFSKKTGKKFIGCSNFPTCDYTEFPDSPKKAPAEVTAAPSSEEDTDHLVGTVCPKCHHGHIVLKKGRFGTFYGCSDFPKCRFTRKISKKN